MSPMPPPGSPAADQQFGFLEISPPQVRRKILKYYLTIPPKHGLFAPPLQVVTNMKNHGFTPLEGGGFQAKEDMKFEQVALEDGRAVKTVATIEQGEVLLPFHSTTTTVLTRIGVYPPITDVLDLDPDLA